MTVKFHIEPINGLDEVEGLEWRPVDMRVTGGERVRGVIERPRFEPTKGLHPLAAKLLAVGMASAQVR